MKLIVDCKPNQTLADLAPVKLALLELGYTVTIAPDGNLRARLPETALSERAPVSIQEWRRWPPRDRSRA